jgi:hypothetical protein
MCLRNKQCGKGIDVALADCIRTGVHGTVLLECRKGACLEILTSGNEDELSQRKALAGDDGMWQRQR